MADFHRFALERPAKFVKEIPPQVAGAWQS